MDALARSVGCSHGTVHNVVRRELERRRALARPQIGESGYRLRLEEREQISVGLAKGLGIRAIARLIGRDPSTVSREVRCGGGRDRYRAIAAHRGAIERARRPKQTKLSGLPRLCAEIERLLGKRYSPQQISARLKVDFPDDLSMRISHETIYQSLYIQSRGELRRQLTENLRTQRRRRKPRGSTERRGRIAGMVPISARPPEIEDRAVPGHWEGDLIVGKAGKSYIATLVERHTRYVMLARLGDDRRTDTVIEALKGLILRLPDHLVQSLTWDQGNELAAHRRLSTETGIDIYFCDPHSPWQRGSNENTNGLLRQYLPKGTDLGLHTQKELDAIAAELNDRPRKTLSWLKPAEKMEQLLR